MTDKQKLEVLYDLMGDIAFDEMFLDVYTSILSLNDRTPHGLHHVTFSDLKGSVKDDYAILFAVEALERNDGYTDGICNTKDVSMFILNPFTDVDLLVLQVHDLKSFGGGADAINKTMSFAADDKGRIYMVNVIVMSNMYDDLIRGRGPYVYGIMGHEIVHFLMHYMDLRVLDHKYSILFPSDDKLLEAICDLWSFAITEYSNNYEKYKDCESISKAYEKFLDNNGRIPNEYNNTFGPLLDKEQPIWLRKLEERLKKKK